MRVYVYVGVVSECLYLCCTIDIRSKRKATRYKADPADLKGLSDGILLSIEWDFSTPVIYVVVVR